MKKELKVIDFDKYEIRIIITALNDLRNRLLNEDKDTFNVDELLLKVLDAPEKKRYFSKSHFLGER